MPNGPPSLVSCKKLTVEGKCVFAAGVVFKGDVKVVGDGTLPAGTYGKDKEVVGGVTYETSTTVDLSIM